MKTAGICGSSPRGQPTHLPSRAEGNGLDETMKPASTKNYMHADSCFDAKLFASPHDPIPDRICIENLFMVHLNHSSMRLSSVGCQSRRSKQCFGWQLCSSRVCLDQTDFGEARRGRESFPQPYRLILSRFGILVQYWFAQTCVRYLAMNT